MVSAETPLKISACHIQLTSGQAGDTFLVAVQGRGSEGC